MDDAAAGAHALLRPGGVLVLDEFAWDQADRAAAAFFYGQRRLLAAAGAVPGNEPADDEPGDDGQRLDDALRWWRYDHDRDPPLHDGAAMLAAVDRRFRIAAVSWVPHLWRYLGQDLPDRPRGYALARRLRALETGYWSMPARLPRSACGSSGW